MNPSKPVSSLPWPLWQLPMVATANWYELGPQTRAHRYRSASTHALHLYEFSGTLDIAGEIQPLAPGVLSFTPCGTVSQYDIPTRGRVLCVHFRERQMAAGDTVHLPCWQQLGALHDQAVAQLNEVIYLHALSASEPAAGAAAAASLQRTLVWLHTAAGANAQQETQGAEAALFELLQHIDQGLRGTLSVPELCRKVGYSQPYLSRCFRQRFGTTIASYIVTRRLRHAAHLLKTSDQSVGAIAKQAGIPDAQHFNKQFRRHYGESPSRWRQTGGLF